MGKRVDTRLTDKECFFFIPSIFFFLSKTRKCYNRRKYSREYGPVAGAGTGVRLCQGNVLRMCGF